MKRVSGSLAEDTSFDPPKLEGGDELSLDGGVDCEASDTSPRFGISLTVGSSGRAGVIFEIFWMLESSFIGRTALNVGIQRIREADFGAQGSKGREL